MDTLTSINILSDQTHSKADNDWTSFAALKANF
jgi:hypothetical protein